MDPKVAYYRMNAAWRMAHQPGRGRDDLEEALEHAQNIIEWLDKGGFVPKSTPNIEAEAISMEADCLKALAEMEHGTTT